jgi:hypothetical protein
MMTTEQIKQHLREWRQLEIDLAIATQLSNPNTTAVVRKKLKWFAPGRDIDTIKARMQKIQHDLWQAYANNKLLFLLGAKKAVSRSNKRD